MSTFSLRIGTPDGLLFEGEAERVICRTITGDVAILAGHTNYCTALGMGEAKVVFADGSKKEAACIGGMLTMMDGVCRLMATTWEWEDEIDKERAENAKKRAEEKLARMDMSDKDYKMVQAKLHRALVRLSVKN